MPNHSRNRLWVFIDPEYDDPGDDDDGGESLLNAFAAQAEGTDPVFPSTIKDDPAPAPSLLCFDRFLPVPPILRSRAFGAEDLCHFDYEVMESVPNEGVETVDGCASAYDWCSKHWGTKWSAWDIQRNNEGSYLEYAFTCAWSWPLAMIQAMSCAHPRLVFQITERNEYDGFFQLRYAEIRAGAVVSSFPPDEEP